MDQGRKHSFKADLNCGAGTQIFFLTFDNIARSIVIQACIMIVYADLHIKNCKNVGLVVVQTETGEKLCSSSDLSEEVS